MSKYTIALHDGKQLNNLGMNGSMFVSQEEITRDMLDDEALRQVTITEDSASVSVMHNAICDSILHWPEGWMFNLREETPQERQAREMREENEMLENAIAELAEIIGGAE